ncbi:MAG: AbrB/MazE/SpoVT family DNA-binding domain-containing protein [Pseudomonadota bacterium]
MSKRLKIRQIGNSAGIVLPKEMLAKLSAEVGDEVEVVATENGISLSALNDESDDTAREWIKRGAERYRETLRALSK